jgi:acetolactate synthase-1/2/3 large subunit
MKNILDKSEKPLVLAGYGIHLSDSQDKFLKFINKYNIPFVTTFLSKDYVDYRHNLNIGTIGIKGSRAGNFAIHNCDYLLVLGSSLGPAHIGYNEKIFSPSSYKVFVNIDKYEKLKDNVNVDLFIDCNLRDFFDYV